MSMEILRATTAQDAAGVAVQRLLTEAGAQYGPIIGWDQFHIAPTAGLPEQRDSGQEVVTYLLAGALRHEDDRGNRATVCAGGAQRVSTGRGLSHAAVAQGGVPARGIRLRIGLPARMSRTEPAFQQVDPDRFPSRSINGGRLVTIIGEGSPLELAGDMRCYDVHLDPGVSWQDVVPAGFRGLVYTVSGSAAVDARDIDQGDACFFDDPGRIRIEAREECRLLYCTARPYGQERGAA